MEVPLRKVSSFLEIHNVTMMRYSTRKQVCKQVRKQVRKLQDGWHVISNAHFTEKVLNDEGQHSRQFNNAVIFWIDFDETASKH